MSASERMIIVYALILRKGRKVEPVAVFTSPLRAERFAWAHFPADEQEYLSVSPVPLFIPEGDYL